MENFIFSDKKINQDKISLLWLQLNGKDLIGKEEIKDLDLNNLQKIFNAKDNLNFPLPYQDEDFDPYRCNRYSVTKENLEIFQLHLNYQIELDKYLYEIAAYARES